MTHIIASSPLSTTKIYTSPHSTHQMDTQNSFPLTFDAPKVNKPIHPYQLGASLYMPATRSDIWEVISRKKLPKLNSVIICLEDAVSDSDVAFGLDNLKKLLEIWSMCDNIAKSERPLVFIRPRHPKMLLDLANMTNIDLVDGFVMPKVDMDSLSDWRMACQEVNTRMLLMPTLETGRLFDTSHNKELATALSHAFDERIFALRIGGNDLFSCLRQRRPNNMTIYETPVGMLIYQLLGIFAVQGYYLTAPVFEYFDSTALFMQELSYDVSLGLVGKTVIHPSQISLVHQAFCVPTATLDEAKAILDSDAKAVFKHNNTMLEPATHYNWATEIMYRASVFGVLGSELL